MSDLHPLIISAPDPRDLDLIFTDIARQTLSDNYRIVECKPDELEQLDPAVLSEASYVLGQPPISEELLGKLTSLRAVLNVEGNLFDNMPYEVLFARGIHVLTTMEVFAEPVAELGLAMALNLARGIIDADQAFNTGEEKWGLESNDNTRLLSGADVGFIGFGGLGKALNKLLTGFQPNVMAFDPWLPASVLKQQGVTPASLDTVLKNSDFVFVTASVTSENEGFLSATEFASMRAGAALILVSRAAVVNFDDLIDAVETGHIVAASDVFPQEPLSENHRVRKTRNFIRSAHRAGAMDVAFKRMGDMVLEDMALMDRGLPPMRCKRAERETVAMMRSKPVEKS